jgi:APA family basic amino acid/polyamine antiporter
LGLFYQGGITSERISSFSGNELNFGMALLLSVYSYTGWNASCYFAGHIRNPKRNLPLSLLSGVFIVIILYLAVNYGLMQVLGEQQLSGQVDFLSELGTKISGKLGSQLISATVLVILLASISSMVFTGSRIPLLKKNHTVTMHVELGRTGIVKMHVLQVGIAALLIVFTGFQQLLLLLTIVLTFFTILTAFGIFLLPWKRLVVSKSQEIGVKLSAATLLLVLIWLVINSFGQFDRLNLGQIILAVSACIGLVLFLIFRKYFRNTSKQKLQVNSI